MYSAENVCLYTAFMKTGKFSWIGTPSNYFGVVFYFLFLQILEMFISRSLGRNS